MKMTFGKRFVMFISITVIGLFLTSILMLALTHSGITERTMRIATVMQDLLLFILPPLICAVLYSTAPARYLRIDRVPDLWQVIVAVGVMIVSIPMMNALIEWNKGLHLPAQFADIEQWMLQSESAAEEAVKLLMGGSGTGSLIISLLIVGVLAGLSEELFFRAGVQRLLATAPMNTHLAIWVTAFIFSSIHLQFFGFFPRLLLGAYFGYLLLWSRSIWLPVLCHIFNNSVVVVTTWMDASPEGSVAAESTKTAINTLGTQGPSASLLVIGSIFCTALLLAALYRMAHRPLIVPWNGQE